MFCNKCGTQALADAEFCQKCGAKLTIDSAEEIQDTLEKQEYADAKKVRSEKGNPINMADKKQQSMDSSAVAKKEARLGKKRLGVCIAVIVLLVCAIIVWSSPLVRIIITLLVAITIAISKLKREPKKLILVIGLAVIATVVISALTGGNDNESDEYVLMVKNGTFDEYPQKTVGEAFDDYFANAVWESGLSEEGVRFVNVRGEILYAGNNAEILVQFVVNEDNEIFAYNACEIDGVLQNDWVVMELFHAIYSKESGSVLEGNLSTENQMMIGITQSYENEFGNMEVTLDYIEFVDKLQNAWTGYYTYPEEDCVFLRAVVTVKNIGTESGSLLTAWNTVVYDGIYKYRLYTTEGDVINIAPLTSPVTEILVFMVPNIVAESDKSLVLNINNADGTAVISYVIRPDYGAGSTDDMPGESSIVDEIETYEISGGYAGTWGNSIANISMYSSGEEDGMVGNISLYLDSKIPMYGGLLIEGKLKRLDVDQFCVQYDDMKILLGVSRDDNGYIMIELYINDEYVESYLMTEQYIS